MTERLKISFGIGRRFENFLKEKRAKNEGFLKKNKKIMSKKDLLEKLKNLGFQDYIVRAFERIDRSRFVPEEERDLSYEDIPLPIGFGQTVSQPRTIAFMLQLLEPAKARKILEVGSGSGYVLALLSEIAEHALIYGAEIIKELAERSRGILAGRKNIFIFHAPKKIGLPEYGSFDRILVSASAKEIPRDLISQLDQNGVLVCPVENSIVRVAKKNNKIDKIKEFPGFVFVPLIK